mmetsp:Transcript_10888/g.31632  ORF Transcript_10888/g.31632 Transcript_10888/m.31632 type:complete len:212 (+) Transcript_10888:56-691(+)
MDGEEISEDNFHQFCNGMPMSMSMGGFQSTLLSKGQADCITFLFTQFRLDESGKFFGAMLCSFFLAVFCEGIAYCQVHVNSHNRQTESNHVQRIIMALLYGFQQLLGWLLMLISMTFSMELFASVILGVFAGKLLFPAEIPASRLALDRGNLGRSGPLNQSRGTAEHSELQHNQQISDDSDSFLEEESRQSSKSCNGSSSSAVRRRRQQIH